MVSLGASSTYVQPDRKLPYVSNDIDEIYILLSISLLTYNGFVSGRTYVELAP